MIETITALLPIFLIIMLWFALRKGGIPSAGAHSGAMWPLIPIVCGHPFRFDLAGDSGASGHPKINL